MFPLQDADAAFGVAASALGELGRIKPLFQSRPFTNDLPPFLQDLFLLTCPSTWRLTRTE